MTDDPASEPVAKRQKTAVAADVNGSQPAADDLERILVAASAFEDDFEQLSAAEAAELYEIQRRYRVQRQGLYDKRNKLLSDIEGFWPHILSLSTLRNYVSVHDKAVFEYLSSLHFHEDEMGQSFEISLHFKQNPFFENTVLTRTTSVTEEQTRISCTKILWRDGQDLTAQIDEEDGQPMISHYSFLNWFITEGVYDSGHSEEGGGIDAVGMSMKTEVWEPALELYNHGVEVPIEEEVEIDIDAAPDGEEQQNNWLLESGFDVLGGDAVADGAAAAGFAMQPPALAPLAASQPDEEEDDEEDADGDEDGASDEDDAAVDDEDEDEGDAL